MYTTEENQVYHFMERINKILETTKIDRMMKYTLFLIKALDPELQKKTKSKQMETFLNKWNRSKKFRRKVFIANAKLLDTEERLAYLGDNYITDPDNTYDQDFEDECMEIEEKITAFVSSVAKELLNEDINL